MSKVMGCWPRGRSTSRPWGYPNGFANSWNRWLLSLDYHQALDVALELDEEYRWDYLDWALEQRRKEKMMNLYYREQMLEAAGENWLYIDTTPWLPQDKKDFIAYVRYRARRLGVQL